MTKCAAVILGLIVGSVQADYQLVVTAKVVTPDNRPVERCAVALTTSLRPPLEDYMWRAFRGQFREWTLTGLGSEHVHVRCEGWTPVLRTLIYSRGRGWSSDSIRFFPGSGSKPVDLGTITLQPAPKAPPN